MSVAAKWDGTFICFGSADSNLKTYDIELLLWAATLQVRLRPNGFRRYIIGGKVFTGAPNCDHGILLRIKNPYHPDHFLFVCAGLGEWGTSGTAYYLFTHWKKLYKKHKQQDFCKIIEVNIGSDESAREIFSISG
jgi:hypothetical protein